MVEGSGAPNNLLARASVGTAEAERGQQAGIGRDYLDPPTQARDPSVTPHLVGIGVAREGPPGWDPQGAQGLVCQTAPG